MWHKYVYIADLNENTSYHTSIGTAPSRVFCRRFPYNFFDLTMNIRPEKPSIPKSFVVQVVPEQTEMIF